MFRLIVSSFFAKLKFELATLNSLQNMSDTTKTIKANYVDILKQQIFLAEVSWEDGVIRDIQNLAAESSDYSYLIPGFIDAHVHIESSMLTPVEFSRLAVKHGTIATLSDPHEIANVLGLEGIHFMFQNAQKTPLKIFYGAPSCVPATPFETAGATLDLEQLEDLFKSHEVCYLSEMMNYPAVLNQDPEVLAKIKLSQQYNLPIDGHAPNLQGEQAVQYAQAGIGTDHECSSIDEALNKIDAGMKILIREGSAARNFEALHTLIDQFPDKVMFCSDDKHPDDLQIGHINQLAARAIEKGQDLFNVLRCACLNPIEHYRLPLGQLKIGEPMDAVEVSDLRSFTPINTWINGQCVASKGQTLINSQATAEINRFHARPVRPEDFHIPGNAEKIRVIKAFDGDLLTKQWHTTAKFEKGLITADIDRDILFLTVINRYQPTKPSVAFINGFGLKAGALASTVAHDSHNIIAVAADIPSLCLAINNIIEHQGGITVVNQKQQCDILPLPIAGLMSNNDADHVACQYGKLNQQAKQLGCSLRAPFMTLSFMALLVIPELKLSDQGLFDGQKFSFTSLKD